MRVTSYAHECQSINPELGAGVFKDCYYNLIEQMMYFPITTLLQTEQNKAKILPLLPFPNPNLYVQLYPLTTTRSHLGGHKIWHFMVLPLDRPLIIANTQLPFWV